MKYLILFSIGVWFASMPTYAYQCPNAFWGARNDANISTSTLIQALDTRGGDLVALINLIKTYHPDWLANNGEPGIKRAWNDFFVELGVKGNLDAYFEIASEREIFIIMAAAYRVESPGSSDVGGIQSMSRSHLLKLVRLWELLEMQLSRNLSTSAVQTTMKYKLEKPMLRNVEVLRDEGFSQAEIALIDKIEF